MCEQTEPDYLDGDVVWVKLGSCWWPGEVMGFDRLPPDVVSSFRKPPIAVVKFFQESTYEYVRNKNAIYKYNCSRKKEFINKGLYMYRSKHGHMEKFPEDIIRAETAVGGDTDILKRDEYKEQKKESYKELFGDTPKKTPGSAKRGRGARGKSTESLRTPGRKIYKEKNDYKVHILVQQSKEPQKESTETTPTPSTSRAGSEPVEEKSQESNQKTTFTTPTVSTSGIYSCHTCSFTTSRLNVLILHSKTHSTTFVPYTPSPVRKKPVQKSASKPSPKVTKTPRAKKEKTEKPKKPLPLKRPADEEKPAIVEVKKQKTDQEIKSSLLADWDDDADEESNDESPIAMSGSPEVPLDAKSPAVPTPAELTSAQVPLEILSSDKKSDDTSDKPESSSDSKYEFCEDEDWPVEADAGRKIPRLKNPSKRKEETKSLSIEEDDMAKEVAELLTKTAVPELPSIPEPLKVEENFPEPPVIKSPDKPLEQSPLPSSPHNTGEVKKAIFKTKTFFRSRHSRSQDAIGKYVAEQLNAERMDISESDLNGSEAVSSPETRDSPPVEQVKVARLAPKIQLKKMKAEAAQLREKEKYGMDPIEKDTKYTIDEKPESLVADHNRDAVKEKINFCVTQPSQDVLYPTQEIKPINKESPDKLHLKEDDSYLCDELLYKKDKDNESDHLDKTVVEKPRHELNVDSTGYDIEETTSTKPNVIIDKVNGSNQLHEAQVPILEDHKAENEKNVDEAENHVLKEMEQTEILSSILPQTEDSNSQSGYSHLPEIVTHGDNINTEEPKKSENLENSVQVDSVGKVEKSLFINSPKSSPRKSHITSPKTYKNESKSSSFQLTEQNIPTSYEQLIEPYMSESTASAVDALLSVSREADRVPKVVGDDPPEDLFEDDKDSSVNETTMDNNASAGTVVSEDNELKSDASYEDSKINDMITTNNEITNESETTTPNDLLEDKPPHITVETAPIDPEAAADNAPSESDLQIAETLINLPSTAIQSNSNEHENISVSEEEKLEVMDTSETVTETEIPFESIETDIISNIENPEGQNITNDDNPNLRFETEQEKTENLNAAQSLVQMSVSMDHKINIVDTQESNDKDLTAGDEYKSTNNGIDSNTVEQKIALLSSENNNDSAVCKSPKFETTSSKLLKMLEEPSAIKPPGPKTPVKQLILPTKEKILNFDVAKSTLKSKPAKQKIIIRRAPSNKSIINNLSEVIASPDKIILSRSNTSQDGSSIQTFTIQASPDIQTSNDPKKIIIQPKFRKVAKPKIQKAKSQNSLINPINEIKILPQTIINEEPMFDINSMPVVLSEDILTAESIEKMPIVMSDGNIISSTTSTNSNPPKLVKAKPTIIENEKIGISAVHEKVIKTTVPEKITITASPNQPEVKTLLMKKPSNEVQKINTPNILSKSSKLRGAKPMLVIDKATGKQKIIMTKSDPTIKEMKQAPALIQPAPQPTAKTEKFIILPTTSSPRPGRTQKIVIDPQTGKARVLISKGPEPTLAMSENKLAPAKIIPASSDTSAAGNTVMIITNAQGGQSRIVLTSEHEKILFPNKQQPNVSQLKTITHRISTNPSVTQKTIVTAAAPNKTQTRIVPKQKSAIITSKGQLIVGGRVATTAQNIAPMPEVRPTLKRIIATEPKKVVQTIQKTTSEPLIFLQQKSGAVMQLTAAQFEHLQRTGQIIQKSPAPVPENKIVVQRSITIPAKDNSVHTVQKQRFRKSATETSTPSKKIKHEVAIAPAPPPAAHSAHSAPVPPLTALSAAGPAPVVTISSIIPTVSNTISISSTPSYPDLENFEELLPSTAIVRQPDQTPAGPALEPLAPAPPPAPFAAPPPEPPPEPPAEPQTQLADGQLLAVPGENFGGPPGTFYLCVEDNGTLTPIDNRPLVLENNQLVPMAEPAPVYCAQPERRDILEAALANSDVFHAEPPRDEAPAFRDLNANVSVHCRVSETSTTLNQPIMTPVEVPSKGESEPAVPASLEDGLAVIGVTPHTVPTSLELPITVTDPRIAPKVTDPLGHAPYGVPLLPAPAAAAAAMAAAELAFAAAEEPAISMPLLDAVGKSMPILTDEAAGEAPGAWARRRPRTPASDASDASEEIALQPAIQLSVDDLSTHT